MNSTRGARGIAFAIGGPGVAISDGGAWECVICDGAALEPRDRAQASSRWTGR